MTSDDQDDAWAVVDDLVATGETEDDARRFVGLTPRVDLAALLCDAVTTDGAHHKQHYLEQIAAIFHVTLPDHTPGIAP